MTDEVEAKIKHCCATCLPSSGQLRYPLSTVASWLIPDHQLIPDVAKMLDFMHIGIDKVEWSDRIIFLQLNCKNLGYEVLEYSSGTPGYCQAFVVFRKCTGIAKDSRCQMLLDSAAFQMREELGKLRP
jgi:hypothetical protein